MDSRSSPYKTLKATYVTPSPYVEPTINIPSFQYKENYNNKVIEHYDNRNPSIWGPPFWFTLHNGALNYPSLANPLCIERMKNFIIGIPIMLPCETCKEHATAYIEKNKEFLDYTCSSRDNLFKFFVDFHNYVNIRQNKPVMGYDDAYKLYDK